MFQWLANELNSVQHGWLLGHKDITIENLKCSRIWHPAQPFIKKEDLNPHAPVPLDAQNGRINKMYIPGNRCFQTWEGKKKDKLKSPNIFRMATGL